MANGNGSVGRFSWLHAFMLVNIALSGWALSSIVQVKEVQAKVVTRLDEFARTRFTDADGRLLENKINTHVHTQ